jgi:nucleotide-binding universal stress UspA family protein
MKIRKILAPTDLSELSRAGLRYGLEVGKSEGTEVVVYNVAGPSEDWLYRHDEFYTADRLIEKHKKCLTDSSRLPARICSLKSPFGRMWASEFLIK